MIFPNYFRKWSTPQRNLLVAYLWGRAVCENKKDLKAAHLQTTETLKHFMKNGVPDEIIEECKFMKLYVDGTFY